MKETVTYRLIRSRRKTLSIEVQLGGEVVVRAPLRAPLSQVDAFAQSRQGWVQKHRARLQNQPAPRQYTEEEVTALKQKARIHLAERVEYYGALMGLMPQGITITQARTRYGSCSIKKRISFSCFLMQSPPEAIDYVVVHELCHLKHMDHSERFYALLSSVLPDWKQRKLRLAPLH